MNTCGTTMLDIALKEWAIVCDLLLEGRLAVLLRKGGIDETGGPGVFELEHPRFALFPSWAHQKPGMIKEALRGRAQELGEPATITFTGIGEAAKIWQVKSRAAFDSLDDLHCWTRPYVDMRFEYKPDRPLYLVALRAHKLTQPKTIAYHAQYAGCRSWVPLRKGDGVDDSTTQPVLSDADFDRLLSRIDAAIGEVRPPQARK